MYIGRRVSAILITIGLSVPCVGAEASSMHPVIQVTVRDMATVAAHWNASVYAQVWKDPALASLRERLDPDRGKDPGAFSAVAMISELKCFDWRCFGVRLDSFGNPEASTALCGDFGAYATEVEREAHLKLYSDLTQTRSLAGADSAFADHDRILARFGSTILSAPATSMTVTPWKIPNHDGDLSMRWDPRALLESVRSITKGDALAQLDAAAKSLGPLLTTIDQRYDLVPQGILQRWKLDAAVPGLAPVDRDVVGRLPGNALTVFAFGVDGKSLWAKGRQPLLEWLNGGSPTGAKRAAQESEQSIDHVFSAIGFDFTLSDLVTGLKGTVVIAITPAASIPAITIAIPRSRQCDAAIAWLLTITKQRTPAEGAQTPLTFPNSPVPLIAARDRTHWLITSDAALAAFWLGGKAGGWSQSAPGALALSKALPTAVMIGSSDTQAVLRSIARLVQPLINANASLDPADKIGVVQALAKLAEIAEPGYFIAGFDQGRLAGEGRGVIGNLILPALWLAYRVRTSAAHGADGPEAQDSDEPPLR